ncbi:hypothetical protein AVEN_223864-1 [Araneus ventricosus]|uniref:Uncharacterized protein n=1 Tax=Araneus ventricosus TaxID=182803 RepID=A0A4Y2QL32_ARAVE|nr:hypothetical protein AVEN_123253-1 [Araneus ventricosus]GBN64003.1 hypothetical protein AVEN_223864-1 [Araneus ventricosus]
MKDRPTRQHCQTLRLLHYSPHYERLMQQSPGIPGYGLSSEMGPKSHTTIIVPSGWRESAYLYGSLSSENSRCTPTGCCRIRPPNSEGDSRHQEDEKLP